MAFTKEQYKEWAKRNRAHLVAYHKAYYHANREKRQTALLASYHKHKAAPHNVARVKKYDADRKLKDPAKWKIKNFRNNSRRRNYVRDIASTKAIQDKAAYYGNQCVYCGAQDALVWDHKKPLSKGGCNLLANLAPACKICNAAKHAKWFGAFAWVKCRDQLVTTRRNNRAPAPSSA